MPDLEKIHALHRKGDLNKAKKEYLAFLKTQPQESEVLHALGLICVEQNKLDEAGDYLREAIKYQPVNPNFQLHLANVLKRQGLFNQATTLLAGTIVQHPQYAPAFNNLGTLHYAQGKLVEAIHAYQQALEIEPHYIDAYYNLGLALTKNNELEAAVRIYKHLLIEAPEHSAARYQLASIYLQQEKTDDALPLFLELALTYPQHLETQINLASCYLKQGSLSEAKKYYLKALAIHPQDQQALFNLGYICSQEGNLHEAVRHYQLLLQFHPDQFAAHYNLGVLFFSIKQREPALYHFQEALHLKPQDSAIAHLIKILKQDQNVFLSPPEYLQSLFDYYADHYESHLLNILHYQVPQLLIRVFESIGKKISTKMDILDLGCGTGLCGEVFKGHAAKLVGVDLSSKMLALAAEKKIYDELICDDFMSYLSQIKADFDLIIAGDVFVYIGDLDNIFTAIQAALRPQGLLLFNTEISTAQDYKLNASGRFAHKKSYLEKLARKNKLKLIGCQSAITRIQDNQSIRGQIYLMKAE